MAVQVVSIDSDDAASSRKPEITDDGQASPKMGISGVWSDRLLTTILQRDTPLSLAKSPTPA